MSNKLYYIAFTLFVMLSAGNLHGQPIYIGGHKAVHDALNNVWLCSVPQECFRTDWTAPVVVDSTWTRVVMNRHKFINGDSITFNAIVGGKNYAFSAVDSTGATIEGNITFTFLPVLELQGDFGYEYVNGTVSLNAADSSSMADMSAKLKWRGNYTNGPNKNKRNYHIKFLDENGDKMDRKLLDLRKDNHWKLDAGQLDLLRVRNRVCTDLWIDMSKKPWYQDLEPKAINGSRGRVTEVILNGEYRGIYGLIEPVDRKQLRLVKHDTIDNVFRGQMWSSKKWTRTVTMSQPIAWDNNSAEWDGFEVDYPNADDVMPTDWSTLADAVWFVNGCDTRGDYQAFEDSASLYFDVPVLIDYLIFIVSLQILDNESKNIVYSCYDNVLSPRLTLTAWDLDEGVGAPPSASWPEEKISPERPIDWISNLPMNILAQIPSYQQQIIDRYWELRQTYLNTDSVIARFQRVVDQLEMSGAAAREEARWTGDTDIWGRTLDISAEMEYVANWLQRRFAYLDENVFEPIIPDPIPGDVNDDGEVNIADVNAIINLIVGGSSETNWRADVNSDGEINISDVNAVVDIILNQ